jgi:20S proteasome alpha/beta subunit
MTDQEQQQQQQQPETMTKNIDHSILEPRLYWLDEYGSIQQLPYGAHGYGSHFVWSILDDGYRPDMCRDEAILLMKSCFEQLRQRYIINAQAQTPPCIKCLDANGWQLIR